MDRRPRRRSRKALMWGGVLVVIGVIAGVALVIVAFARLDDKVSSFYRLGAPDVTEVFFSDTGDYVVYDESIGLPVDGEAPFEVTVRRTGTGLEVPVSASVDDVTYDTGGKSGTAVFEFSIPAVGSYEIEADVSTEAGLAQLAVGRSVLGDLLRGLVTAAVVGGGLILAGVLVAVVGSIPRPGRTAREGSTERTEGSRERSDSSGSGRHGRSPLTRRAEDRRAAAEAPPPPVLREEQPSSPPPPPPPPPPPTQVVVEEPPPPPVTSEPLDPVEFEPVSYETAEFEPVTLGTSKFEPVTLGTSEFEPVTVETAEFEPVTVETTDFEPVRLETVDFEPLVVEVASGLGDSSIEIEGLERSSLEVAGLPATGLEVEGLGASAIELSEPVSPDLAPSEIAVEWPDSGEAEDGSLRP